MKKAINKFNARQSMETNGFEIYWYNAPYNKEIELHHHDFYEIYFFIKGDVKYIIEDRIYNLLPGDILLISPWELHQPRFSLPKDAYERIVIWVNKHYLYSNSTMHTDLSRCFYKNRDSHTNLLRLDPLLKEYLNEILEKLLNEINNKSYGSDVASQCYFLELIIEINRLAKLPQQRHELKDKSTSIISSVLSHINEYYYEELSLELLSNKFFISKYYLSHEFKRLVGTSVYRYIIQKRLQIAKVLLEELQPTDVYKKCGFGDYANFYRGFKSQYGISPKDYKKLNSKKPKY
ncbi:MAG: AraC family transcriptional regulator [Lachnospirales bacterium]